MVRVSPLKPHVVDTVHVVEHADVPKRITEAKEGTGYAQREPVSVEESGYPQDVRGGGRFDEDRHEDVSRPGRDGAEEHFQQYQQVYGVATVSVTEIVYFI